MRASLNPMRSADHIDSMNAKVDLDSASSGGRGSVVGNPMQRSRYVGCVRSSHGKQHVFKF